MNSFRTLAAGIAFATAGFCAAQAPPVEHRKSAAPVESSTSASSYESRMRSAYREVGFDSGLVSKLVQLDSQIYRARTEGEDVDKVRGLLEQRSSLLTDEQHRQVEAYFSANPVVVNTKNAEFAAWQEIPANMNDVEARRGGERIRPAQLGLSPQERAAHGTPITPAPTRRPASPGDIRVLHPGPVMTPAFPPAMNFTPSPASTARPAAPSGMPNPGSFPAGSTPSAGSMPLGQTPSPGSFPPGTTPGTGANPAGSAGSSGPSGPR